LGEIKIRGLVAACVLISATLTGCAASNGASSGADPLEPMNRGVHAFNKGLDRVFLRPVARATTGSGGVRDRVSNFSDNLGKPADIVNNVLQLRLVKAAENTLRFSMNTVFGLGGLFDVATEAGMPENDTDFGETLHIWGFGEGPYVELPLLGPSTARDTVGEVVDMVIDPLNTLPTPESYVSTAAKIASKIGDRGKYFDTVDSILYDSADSYEQAKMLYLQNRRYELGDTTGEDSFVDPYEDPYGQ
jgi:phospholipid-binding lipoprotein MlaA